MDRVQLSQGCRVTSKKQLTLPDIHMIDHERMKG